MKKTACIGLLLILCLCLAACGGHKLELDTLEKIAEVYRANEERFRTAAETAAQYEETEERIGIGPSEARAESDVYACRVVGDLFIEGSDALTDEDFQLLYDAFAPLMDSCRFCGAAMNESKVEFVLERTSYGAAAELYYFPDAAYAAEYMSQAEPGTVLRIDPHWYAEIISD